MSRFCVLTFLAIALATAAGCNRSRQTSADAAATSNEVSEVSQALVGKQITIRGKFSLLGKPGPYIALSNHEEVYLESKKGSFFWGKPYTEMEGKLVTATGTLRFYHAPEAKPNETAVQHVPDFFYLEIETTEVRLVGTQ